MNTGEQISYKSVGSWLAFFIFLLVFVSGCAQDNYFPAYELTTEEIQAAGIFESKSLENDTILFTSSGAECLGVSWVENYDTNYPLQLNILNCVFENSSSAKLSFEEIPSEYFNDRGSCNEVVSNFGDSSLQVNCILNDVDLNETFLIVLHGNQRYTINIVGNEDNAEEKAGKVFAILKTKDKFEKKLYFPKAVDYGSELIIGIVKKSENEWKLIGKWWDYLLTKTK